MILVLTWSGNVELGEKREEGVSVDSVLVNGEQTKIACCRIAMK
jgi:hypothetical protein